MIDEAQPRPAVWDMAMAGSGSFTYAVRLPRQQVAVSLGVGSEIQNVYCTGSGRGDTNRLLVKWLYYWYTLRM